MKFLIEYSIRENCRKKCYFFTCLIACFLVSFVCLIAKSIINQGSLLFLMLGEKDSGEIDFFLTPKVRTRNSSFDLLDDYHQDNAFINYSIFERLMEEEDENEIHIDNKENPYNSSVIRTYFNGYSPYNKVYLILINTDREKEIELGRAYPYHKLNKGECLVHKNLIVNDTEKKFNISISMKNFIVNTLLYFYHDIKNKNDNNDSKLKELLSDFNEYISFTCDIVDTFKDNYGKEAGEDDNLVIMEQEYFYQYIYKYIPKEILETFPNYSKIVKNIKAEDYGNTLIINFPKNRLKFYMEEDYETLLDKGIKFMNKVVYRIGSLDNYKVDMPLIRAMENFKFGTILLNLILNIILIGIFGLSLILIHSLILITTETHSFEFGILRLIGNNKKNIILIIILECLSFSIPAFILALFSSYYTLSKINDSIKKYLNTDLNISVTYNGFIIAFALNFLGPILSAIFPIRNILRKNISTSLNTIINKTQGMKIEVISLQQRELTSLVIFGLINFIYGASIYYFLPLSLLSFNLGLIGGIFLWILFGILLGLVLLSRNVETFLQKILTYILLFFTKSYIKILILKNLAAHRLKNKKTSLVFSLSVGLLIMTKVGLDLILQSSKNMILRYNGSEIVVYNINDYFIPKNLYKSMMELYDKRLIDSFSFYTLYLNDICLNSNFFITNYGRTVSSNHNILAINPSYFSTTSKADLKIDKQFKQYKYFTPSEQLYFSDFKGKSGIGGILKSEFNVNLNSKMYLKFLNKKNEMLFLSKPAFILNSAGGLFMNDNPNSQYTNEAIISIPLYLEMLQKCRSFFAETLEDLSIIDYENLPIWGINIKSKENSTEKDIEEINSMLKLIEQGGDIWFFSNMKKRLDIISNIIYFLLYTISAIVLIFSLFNLTASMTINIFDQKKEIAIFRALGTKKKHIIFIYVGESFILILTSSLIGIIIGSIISYTMALQWVIFTKINVTFNFPIANIILIIIFSIFGGIVSTYFPAKNMLNYSIADLKRTG